ncbi:hypothetical protein E5S67_06166 [Microcoleus sp. IPMA8]|uniref:Uncharacterized protein n=2 Tax=Microcoleus TaxID=44471 RepID=A0ABX2D6U5_9CYAN|nr:hypothetical protein [Microcoleus asticus IPMA8]
MANKARNKSGKFAPKSEVPRKIRSVNLTDTAWQWLATVADKAGMSRNDYLEALASGNSPFMGMPQPLPQPFIETVQEEIETHDANMVKQPDSELLLLFIEMAGLEVVRADNQRLHNNLGNLEAQREQLNQELAEIQSQLVAERALREKIERELSELKQNSVQATMGYSRDTCKCDSFWRNPFLGGIPGFSRVTLMGLSPHFNPLLMTT